MTINPDDIAETMTGNIYGGVPPLYRSSVYPNGFGQPPSADYIYAGLTPAIVSRIQAQWANRASQPWDSATQAVASNQTRIVYTGPSGPLRNLLRVGPIEIITGICEQSFADWFHDEYIAELEYQFTRPVDSGFANYIREAGVKFALAYIWFKEHMPEFFTQQEWDRIVVTLESLMEKKYAEVEEYIVLEFSGNRLIGDTDLLLSSCNIYEHHLLIQEYSTDLKNRMIAHRDILYSDVKYLYRQFHPVFGQLPGKRFESSSYDANTPRQVFELFKTIQNRTGLNPFNNDTVVQDYLAGTFITIMFDPENRASGFWGNRKFNDPITDTTPASDIYALGGSHRVTAPILTLMLHYPTSSEEHRILRWLWYRQVSAAAIGNGGTIANTATQARHELMMSEDPAIPTLAFDQYSGPKHVLTGGPSPSFLSTENFTADAWKMHMDCWLTNSDHFAPSNNHVEFYWRGVAATRYQESTSSTQLLNVRNCVSIETNSFVGIETPFLGETFYLSGDTNRRQAPDLDKYAPTVYAYGSDEEYAIASIDNTKFYTVETYQNTKTWNYVNQSHRTSMLIKLASNVAMGLILDSVETQNTSDDSDTDGIAGIRKQRLIHRCMTEPSFNADTGFHECPDRFGLQVGVMQLGDGVQGVYDEINMSGNDLAAAGVRDDRKKWDLTFETTDQLSTNFVTLTVFGDAGFSYPTVTPISVIASGQIQAWQITGVGAEGSYNTIVVIPTNAGIELNETIDFTAPSSVSGANVWFTHLLGSAQYSISNPSGNQIVATLGSGASPDATAKIIKAAI